MSLIEHLLEKSRSLSRDAKYTVLNGVAYMAVGTLLIAWPGVTQTVSGTQLLQDTKKRSCA